jgi:hypothetical protein
MRIADLEATLIKTTKILAGEVDVHMEGFAPRVEYNPTTKQPEKIFIPSLPSDIPKNLVPAIHGYIDHEVSHVMFSEAEDICDTSKSKLWHYVHNCIEDPRVNRTMGEYYKGSQKNIKAGYDYLFADHKDPSKPNPYNRDYVDGLDLSDPKALAEFQMQYSSLWFAKKMGCPLSSDKYDELDLDRFYDDLESKMDPLKLNALKNIRDAADVRESSDYYEGFFSKEALEKMHPEKGKGKSEGAKGKEEGKPDPTAPPKTLEEQLAEKLKWEVEECIIKSEEGIYWTNRFDTKINKHDIANSIKPNVRTNVHEFEEEAKTVSNYIAKDLRRLLEERRRQYYVGGYKSGKLNTKKLYSVRMGNDRIFKKKNEIRAVNAAVSLLVDLSGSMIGDKVKVAMLSAYAFALVLEQIKIPYEVFGFCTANGSGEMMKEWEKFQRTTRPEIIKKVVNGFCPEQIYAFKEFGETFDLTSKTGMAGCGNSGIPMIQNEDSKHVKLALERLSKRPENVKALFVFSDGVPAFHVGNAGQQLLAYNNLKYYAANAKEKYGVDIYSIGIISESVSKFYPKYKIINKLPELPTALFDYLRKTFV